MTDAGTRQCQAGKQQGGTTIVHAAQNVRLNQLLTYQSNGDITNNLQTLGAHLVDRVLGRVIIRKREVDDIDRVDTRLLQWHMIVGEGLAGSRREPLSVTELIRDLPYSLHYFRCLRHRKPFLKKLQVFVPYHVEQHRKQGC